VRGVGDQYGARAVRDLAQVVVLGRVAGVIDSGDRLGAAGHGGLDGGRVEVGGVVLDVGEDHGGAEHGGGRRGRHESHRRGDDLIARSDSGGRIGCVQRCGAVDHGNAGRARDRGQVLLELIDPGSGGQPVAVQRRDDRLDVRLVNLLSAVRQHHFSSSRLRISSTSSHRSLLSER
jgi:hypothetical protein